MKMKRLFCALLAVWLLVSGVPVGVRAADILYGDVNGDGRINAKDATLILRHSVGKLTEDQKFDEVAANVNADDRINAKDATLILRYSVKKLDKFPADTHEHSYEAVVTQPSCTEGGYTTYTCSCGNSYKDTETAALGHSWGDWVRTKEPTTEAEGQDTRECSRCGKTETRAVEKLPEETEAPHEHSYEAVVTAPTCTKGGYTTHTCVCGDSYTDSETEAVDHQWSDWTSDANGSYCYCTTCGRQQVVDGVGSNYADEAAELINDYRESKGLPRLEIVHDNFPLIRAEEIKIDFKHTRLDGSSFRNGTMWYSECYAIADDAQSAVEKWIQYAAEESVLADTRWSKICVVQRHYLWKYCWVVMFALDNESEGCTEHNYTSVVESPFCETPGYTVHTCECGDIYMDNKTNPVGHQWGEWEVSKYATIDTEGEEVRVCQRRIVDSNGNKIGCGNTEYRKTDKLPEGTCPHNWGENWGEWTSDNNGSYGSCTNCGQSITIDGSTSSYAQEVIDIINEYRAAEGLAPVEWFASKGMLIRAHELTVCFSHNRPDGSHGVGTCLAAGYSSARAAVDGWMSSSNHRGSLMNPDATEACAAYNGSYWALYIG